MIIFGTYGNIWISIVFNVLVRAKGDIMNVTVDLKTLGFILLIIAALILIIYLILLVRKLLVTLDHANKILVDLEDVSDIASRRGKEVDGVISDVTDSVGSLAGAVKDKQNVVQATSSVVRAIASVKNAVSKD